MNPSLRFVLILTTFSGTFGKYVYVEKELTWGFAQRHCRALYIDLAPVATERDGLQLLQLEQFHDVTEDSWIGLMKMNSSKAWMWSGGVVVSWTPMAGHATAPGDNAIAFSQGYMIELAQDNTRPFYCYNAIVVQEKKTWEEALEYCRENHLDLASVASETEMMLIQSQLVKRVPSSMVWIGLHSFPKGWVWVDGQTMTNTPWTSEEYMTCPPVDKRCAALKAENGVTSGKTDHGQDEPRVNSIWEAHNCYDELPFVCY